MSSEKWWVYIAVTFYICVALFSVYFASAALLQATKLPCGVSEISPDFSHEQREQCRKGRNHKL
jgi:hypothetical protein